MSLINESQKPWTKTQKEIEDNWNLAFGNKQEQPEEKKDEAESEHS